MSVADIFKLQTGYNLHDKFNDQTNWQDAFKIADAFNQSASLGAKAKEDWRKYYENRDTHQTRVDAMNAVNRYTQNNAQWQTQFNDQTMPNKIEYTNWDYGNKTRVGNFEWQQAKDKALREAEQRTLDAELNSWIKKNGFDENGNLRSYPELAKYANELHPNNLAKLFPSFFPKQQELSWQDKQDYEHNLRRQNIVDDIISKYQRDGGDITSPDGRKFMQSVLQTYGDQASHIMGKYGISMGTVTSTSPTAPMTATSPTVFVEGVTKGVPMVANTANTADVQVPYAYGTKPTTPVAPTQPTATATVTPVDYGAKYGITPENIGLINELALLTYQTPEEVINKMHKLYGSQAPKDASIWLNYQLNKANDAIQDQLDRNITHKRLSWGDWENRNAAYLP